MDHPTIKIESKQIQKFLLSTDLSGPPDLQIRCLDGLVKCDRKVLAAFSLHFENIEPEVTAIRISDVSLELFSTMVQFHETGECLLRRSTLDGLLRTSKKLGFRELQTAIERIMKSEVPGVFTVEEFILAAEESEIDIHQRMGIAYESNGLHDGQVPVLVVGSTSSESDVDHPSHHFLDDDFDGDSDSFDDDHEYIHNPVRGAIMSGAEYSQSNAQRTTTPCTPKTRWKKEEVDALRSLWPQLMSKDGRRLDLRGIAAAMQTLGYDRGTEQVKQKIYRLQREERYHHKKSSRYKK